MKDIHIFLQDDRSIEVDLIGPSEIPLDSAGVYVMVTHCAVKSDNFTFDIVGPEETDVVTVGNLGVKGEIFYYFKVYYILKKNIFFSCSNI